MIKIQPIKIEDGASVQSITKNITSSVAFILATASEINRVIAEINNLPAQEESKKEAVAELDIDSKVDLHHSEFKSWRNITGIQIDELQQKLNKLSEVK